MRAQIEIAPMTWDEARWFADLFSNGDEQCEQRITLAETDWPGFVIEVQGASLGAFIGELDQQSPAEAVTATLLVCGYLRMLDWKFADNEVIGHYTACLRVNGLAPLSDADADRLHALDPIDERQEHLFFPDLAAALDDHATSLGRRLLGGGEHDGTSYLFAVVTLDAFNALVGHGFGPLYFYDVAEEHPRSSL